MDKGTLKEAVISKLRNDKVLQLKLAASEEIDRSFDTIRRWVKENHASLSLPACMSLICSAYKITPKQALA